MTLDLRDRLTRARVRLLRSASRLMRGLFHAGAAPSLMPLIPEPPAAGPPEPSEQFLPVARGRAFKLGLAVVVLALLSAFATYVILTDLTPIRPTNDVVLIVLLVNALLVLGLIALVARQVMGLLRARREQAAGARLHVRIVTLFSVIAVLPAIILALFASASLNRALDRLFSKGTEQIVIDSIRVAKAYLSEHGQVIRSDIVAMANDVDGRIDLYKSSPHLFQNELFQQAQLRNLAVAYVLDATGKVLVAAPNPYGLPYEPPSTVQLGEAKSGEVVIVPPEKTNQVGALKKLPSFADAYLYVGREVNAKVLEHLRRTEVNISKFRALERRRMGTQYAFGFMHVMVALTLLMASVWTGMWFANALVAPIRRLITAAQQVARGNLDVQVPVRLGEGDLGHLSTIFNRMTDELSKQRNALVSTNSQLDERRQFIEAVLSGVSAGVLGIGADGRIAIANTSAHELLGRKPGELLGAALAEALPEFDALLQKSRALTRRERVQEQLDLTVAGTERHFALQLTREGNDAGYVLTFDDITGLVAAQRTSAWADVARRIAHEIKNPLTPIQLSAERIKRKYGSVIGEDREVFDRCTETIIRQVGDLRRMVDEFSSFARLPKPIMEPQDIRDIVKETVFMFQVSSPDVDFKVAAPDRPVTMKIDRRLVSQALINLVKNATEGIATQKEQAAGGDYRGRIELRVEPRADKVMISVIDNGIGLPKKDRGRLVEPYMTTRAKGTGIGLAVVHRVTEQHGGTLLLEDAPADEGFGHGAAVRMLLPRGIDETSAARSAGAAPEVDRTTARPSATS